MNSSTLRRLAADHSSLHTAGLPPYYLFPSTDPSSCIPDDLTKLTVLLTGPQGTPYSEGLWKLTLTIPNDYPKSPPRAAFRTRIWHPNVEEKTGHVCVDTLKRDWDPKLTLRDILITITCLLIHPNPDSALNASAGHLLHEDYETFARQAQLMASIHARIPRNLQNEVLEAKRRGDESEATPVDRMRQQLLASDKSCATAGIDGERSNYLNTSSFQTARSSPHIRVDYSEEHNDSSDADTDDEASASKENDPSLSPSPVTLESPRISASIKRPLSDLPIPTEPENDPGSLSGSNFSAQNIPNNVSLSSAPLGLILNDPIESLKLMERSRIANHISCALHESGMDRHVVMSRDARAFSDDDLPASKKICSREEKENGLEELGNGVVAARPVIANGNAPTARLSAMIARKSMLNPAVPTRTARPRVGLRRL